jgi:hypothetical protein
VKNQAAANLDETPVSRLNAPAANTSDILIAVKKKPIKIWMMRSSGIYETNDRL